MSMQMQLRLHLTAIIHKIMDGNHNLTEITRNINDRDCDLIPSTKNGSFLQLFTILIIAATKFTSEDFLLIALSRLSFLARTSPNKLTAALTD
jgi:hypothetical protein